MRCQRERGGRVGLKYGAAVTRRLQAMGIRDGPITPRSPWQNGHVERLIGSIRRECLDHVVVLGETHLRHLANYATYYNRVRTHLALDKDAPLHRPAQKSGLSHQSLGSAISIGTTFGWHNRYTQLAGRHACGQREEQRSLADRADPFGVSGRRYGLRAADDTLSCCPD